MNYKPVAPYNFSAGRVEKFDSYRQISPKKAIVTFKLVFPLSRTLALFSVHVQIFLSWMTASLPTRNKLVVF